MSKPSPTIQTNSAAKWTDLRDENGKLCARLDAHGMVLEIRRSDRKQVAQFNLAEILRGLDTGKKSE
jgi:hypothetical protein